MSDMGDIWKSYREMQKARRSERLPRLTDEINALSRSGFVVESLTDYQFRINGRLDLYPIHRRWHDIKTGERGGYQRAKTIAIKRLRTQHDAS